jgi:hypothetical protein
MADSVARGRLGIALVAASVAVVAIVASLGESAATRAPGASGWFPPYAWAAHPPAGVVVALLWVAILCGAAGALTAWRAIRGGWAPDPRKLLAGGLFAAAVLVLVPVTSSDDVYSYTAYGRMSVLGYDPYTTSPRDLGNDPVAREAGDPWIDSPSVYGPLATAEQAVVMHIAGADARRGAWLLALGSALAFAATGIMLYLAARDDPGRRRAALLWTLNPLLLLHLVAGAHVDALLVALGVAALLVLRRLPFVAGLLGGAACCVKLTGVLVAAAMAWVERRNPRRLAALGVGGVLVVIPAFAAAGGLTAFKQVREASNFVSRASPWRALSVPLDSWVGHGTSRGIVTTLSLITMVGLAWLLASGLPSGDPVHRAAAVATLAWLLGATYVLPWYDSWAWPLLVLLPASRWDGWLLARTTVLSIAYVPGRTVPMPTALHDLLNDVRSIVAPVLVGVLLLIALWWCALSRPRPRLRRASPTPLRDPAADGVVRARPGRGRVRSRS